VESFNRRIKVQIGPEIKESSYLKKAKAKTPEVMTQGIMHLPTSHKALSSTSVQTKKSDMNIAMLND
jgi:hypothetical protein